MLGFLCSLPFELSASNQHQPLSTVQPLSTRFALLVQTPNREPVRGEPGKPKRESEPSEPNERLKPNRES